MKNKTKFFTEAGQEVHFGDKLYFDLTMPVNDSQILEGKLEVEITKANIRYLISTGKLTGPVKGKKVVRYNNGHVLISCHTHEDKAFPLDIDFYLNSMAKRAKLDVGDVKQFVKLSKRLGDCNPASIILKEVAIQIDYMYPNHITEQETLLVLDTNSGGLREVKGNEVDCKTSILFRNMRDASFAINLVKSIKSKWIV